MKKNGNSQAQNKINGHQMNGNTQQGNFAESEQSSKSIGS